VPVDPFPFPHVGGPDWGETESGIDQKVLYDEIVQYVKAHVYLNSENMYYVLSSYCLATWIYETFSSFPYVFVLGDFGVGKTRLLEVLHALAHRAIMTPNASEAVVFTMGQYWRPTMLYDESEGLNHETKQAVMSLANAGYKRNSFAYRVDIKEGQQRDIVGFNCYFPKAFAGTKEIPKTLESRCIPFKMTEKPKHVKLNNYMDDAWAYKLRNKLLAYRFLNLNGPPVKGFLEMGVENSRILELFTPILAVTPKPYHDFIKIYAQKTEAIQRAVRGESFAVPLLEAIIDTYGKCKDSKLYLTQIKELLFSEQTETTDGKPITEKFISKQLKEIGFDVETIRRDMRSRYILWDDGFKKWLATILPQYFKEKKELDQMLSRIGIAETVQATLGGA
jgi:hypothetical protein